MERDSSCVKRATPCPHPADQKGTHYTAATTPPISKQRIPGMVVCLSSGVPVVLRRVAIYTHMVETCSLNNCFIFKSLPSLPVHLSLWRGGSHGSGRVDRAFRPSVLRYVSLDRWNGRRERTYVAPHFRRCSLYYILGHSIFTKDDSLPKCRILRAKSDKVNASTKQTTTRFGRPFVVVVILVATTLLVFLSLSTNSPCF